MAAPARKTGITKSTWFKVARALLIAFLLLLVAVLAAKAIRDLPAAQSFMGRFPGTSRLPPDAPVGFPAWLAWEHFLNGFLLLFIIRSGWHIRTATRQAVFWTRNNTGLIRTRNRPNKISLSLWFHLSVDALWVLNGIIFYILLFTTGQWMRLVPVNWDIFPNAVTVAVEYLSLNWPTDASWVNYNSLQVLSYFVTVFLAAPLALITGLRMSPAWPSRFTRINTVYPVGMARAIHFPVMVWFAAFTVAHVTLVLATGALRNLNHMYAVRDDEGWVGFWIFAVSLLVTVGAWFAAQPIILRSVASLSGSVTR